MPDIISRKLVDLEEKLIHDCKVSDGPTIHRLLRELMCVFAGKEVYLDHYDVYDNCLIYVIKETKEFIDTKIIQFIIKYKEIILLNKKTEIPKIVEQLKKSSETRRPLSDLKRHKYQYYDIQTKKNAI